MKNAELSKNLTTIPALAFCECSALETVSIPDSVTIIEGSAFYKCISLKEITIPETVTSMGSSVFEYCTGVTNIYYNAVNAENMYSNFYGAGSEENHTQLYIGDKVETIPTDMFEGMAYLESIHFGEAVTAIGNSAFRYCRGLTSVTVPETVVDLGTAVFYNCEALKTAAIPSNRMELPERTFAYCTNLKTVYYNAVNETGEYGAFNYSGVETIQIGEEVEQLRNSLCSYMTSLITVIMPEGITSIGSNCFNNCTALEFIDIPDTVAAIGNDAFYQCTALTTVGLSASLTAIDYQVFYDCYALTSISIPDNVVTIGEEAFYNCIGLTAFKAGAKVKEIGEEAFYNCKGLTEVDLTGSVEYIGESTFNNCDAIVTVLLGDSLKEIGDSAFYGCDSLTTLEIPESVTKIGVSALGNDPIETIVTYTEGSSNGISVLDNWVINYTKPSDEETEVVIPDGVVGIGDAVFRYQSYITAITLPSSLKYIGSQAFYGSSKIATMTISDDIQIEYIGSDAFYNIPWIDIEEGYLAIGDYFIKCGTNETAFEVPEGITKICENAFASEAIEKVVVPATVTEIGAEAFKDCFYLEKITIPEGIEIIEDSAFRNCITLKEIVLPSSVKELGAEVFQSCISLDSADFSKTSLTSLSEYIFMGCIALNDLYLPLTMTYIDQSFAYRNAINRMDGTVNYNIYGMDESDAQQFAEDMGYTFVSMGQHVHRLTKMDAKEPTCENAGNIAYYTCETCGRAYADEACETRIELKDTVLEATGHSEAEAVYENKVESTCTTEGSFDLVIYCTVCKKELSREHKTVEALGHDYAYQDNGEENHTLYCTRNCGHTITENHSYKDKICVCGNEQIINANENTNENEQMINKIDISTLKIQYEYLSTVYDGTAKEPKVTIAGLTENTDYTVSYTNHGRVGTAVVIISGRGNYDGEVRTSYTILPKGTSIKSVTKGKKRFTVKWKKQATEVTGYQIRYSTKSSMKNSKMVTISNAKEISRIVKGLKAKKKYYIQIRTYKKVGSLKYYSKWSGKKSIKTK